ncbi:NAD(P)/FAD-dependent oxidoreductase [Salininema proteolyticum]|uniref:Ferredoxin--NADP reductase n=1 Tax=Salininema proteolyticum TaxID=1607685 RepID=A0ABV8U071_9ACTN
MALTVDMAVIGAGPTGLFCAYYAGFRGLSVAVIDSLPEPGGQITAMYPEKMIYDVAGFPEVKGRDLVDNLVRQAAPFDPHYLLGRSARELEHVDGRPVLTLDDGTEVAAGALVITAGMGNFSPRPLPAASGFEGDGLVYFVPELDAHRDKDVVIVGGGDSAFDWALALHPIARSVTMVHRRAKFRAHHATVEKVRGLGIPIHVNTEIKEILGNGSVRGVRAYSADDETEREFEAHTLVAALGFIADLGPIKKWNLELEGRHILVDSTMCTNQPRVFAAGDIAEYTGKVRLIATGFGEAATAVNNAATVIRPGASVFPGHSSDEG